MIYHTPSYDGVARHKILSDKFIELLELVNEVVPDGREKSETITLIETAKFWASAGVARNPVTR